MNHRERAAWWKRTGFRELELILWAAWDPIDAEVPTDEYGNYVGRISTSLARGADGVALAAQLAALRSGIMGLDREEPDAGDLSAAEKVRTWFDEAMGTER